MSRIAVVGEALLDVDLDGVAHRLSPESPVPVLDDLAEHDRPGGAALAAAMAARDGHDVVLVAPWTDDDAGARLRAALGEAVEIVPLPSHGGTPVKRRVRADGHNLLRLDEGGTAAACRASIPAVDEALATVEAVLVSDYGRDLTHDGDLRGALTAAAQRVPLVWDPHPRGAAPVASTMVMTPNIAELADMDGARDVPQAGGPVQQAVSGAAAAIAALDTRAIAVTLGSRGAVLSFGDGAPEVFAARSATGDTCGAGDRFAVTMTLALAQGRLLSAATSQAVEAATQHVAAGGASAFSGHRAGERETAHHETNDVWSVVERVHASGGTLVATGGCFDLLHAGHVAMLEAARALGESLVVLLNSDDSVRRLKGPTRPLMPAADRARVLESLACVDAAVVFEEDTPAQALERLRPDIWVKGGDYAGQRLPEEDVLQQWGAQAVVVPYLQGRSTSGLVDAMTTR